MRMTEEEYEQLLRTREQKRKVEEKKNKYHSRKVTINGIQFDSKKEANRYCALKMLENAGEISDLKLQVPFELIPTQRDEDGKLLEKKCSYLADFTYLDKDGNLVVEDVKSKATRTTEYRIKRKLMLYNLGIQIKEV